MLLFRSSPDVALLADRVDGAREHTRTGARSRNSEDLRSRGDRTEVQLLGSHVARHGEATIRRRSTFGCSASFSGRRHAVRSARVLRELDSRS
jgi:hypothetical protein